MHKYKEFQKLRELGHAPLAAGPSITPEIHISLHTCYLAEYGRFRSNGTSVIKEIHLEINWPFQGHLRSSEPTWIDPPAITSY